MLKESLVVTNRKAFVADLDIIPGSGRLLVISTKPFDKIGTSSFTTIRFSVKMRDANLQPLYVVAGTSGIVATSGSSWLLESLPILSQVISIYDLIKSTIDALKKAAQSFPIIGYITMGLDTFVDIASASIRVSNAGDTVTVELYTGWYNSPLVANATVFISQDPTYVFVSRVEYIVHDYRWSETIYSVDGPVLPYTSFGATPQGGSNSYFPYRTLTCGAQESRVLHPLRCIKGMFR
jgi:hypothetical protein